MEILNCSNCNTPATEADNFCVKCGNGLKCESCKTWIKKDAIFCSSCGKSVNISHTVQTVGLNSIKYKKSNTEVSCEISFTDNVGKERMNDLLSAIVNSRSGSPNNFIQDQTNHTLKIGESGDTFELNNAVELNSRTTSEETSSCSIEIPHFNDIANRLECSENVWIGIHVFYLSVQGANNFSREDVRDAYMTKRKTGSRVSNFASEWKKAHQKYFKTIKDDEFNFQNGAIADLQNLILEKKIKPSTQAKKSTGASGSKKTSGKSVAIEEFDFSKNANSAKPSLEEFISSKKPGDSTYDRIVVIAYYITGLNKGEIFNEGQIEFAYRALQLGDRPGHLRQTINNIKNTKVWFNDVSRGQWSLERIGEIYVDEKLPHKEDV